MSKNYQSYDDEVASSIVAEPVVQSMSKEALKKAITKTEKDMKSAAKEHDYILAAQLRDELFALQKKLKEN